MSLILLIAGIYLIASGNSPGIGILLIIVAILD